MRLDWWYIQAVMSVVCCWGLLSWCSYKRFGLGFSIIHSYFMASACFWLFTPENFNGLSQQVAFLSKYSAGQSLFLVSIVPHLVYQIPESWRSKLLHGFKMFLVLDAVALLFGWRGFFTANSFDAGVIGACISLFPWQVIVGLFLIILKVGGSTGILAAGASVLVLVWYRLTARGRVLLSVLLPLAVFLGSKAKPDLFSHSGRLNIWSSHMDFWLEHFSLWLGSGFGTYDWIAPFIKVFQVENGSVDDARYVWMHNDFLTILFETGFIGLGLVVGYLIWLLWKKRFDSQLMAEAMGFLTLMFFYSPMRFFILHVYGLLLLGRFLK